MSPSQPRPGLLPGGSPVEARTNGMVAVRDTYRPLGGKRKEKKWWVATFRSRPTFLLLSLAAVTGVLKATTLHPSTSYNINDIIYL